MEEFFTKMGILWNLTEWLLTLLGVVFGLYLFLKDQIRRDRFFGFIPTVITVVYDPKEKKVLVGHLNGGVNKWIFPQGRVEESLLASARQVLSQELGLERSYKLLGSMYLGRTSLRREKTARLDRFMDPAEFTLFRFWRGKAYTVLFVETKVESAMKELDADFLYEDVQFVDLAEARDLLTAGHRNEKAQMYLNVLDALEKEMSK